MTQKTCRLAKIALLLLTIVLIDGCARTTRTEATGKGTIRGINALVDSPDVTFKIEERGLGDIKFKNTTGFVEYDDLTYNFNFDFLQPGDTTQTRLATQFIDVILDMEYTIILTGTMADPSIIFWEAPEREWIGDETVFEADFTHQASTLGAVDVYFALPGTIPVPADAVATLNYGERVPYREFPDGVFELIITPAGDPGNFLFQSASISSTPATRITMAIFDADPSITAAIAVNLVNASGGSANLFDVNRPANIRVLHAAFGTASFDGFFNNDFTNIIFPNIGYGVLSAYVDSNASQTVFTMTQVGNIGAPIFETELSIGNNTKRTAILGGEPGALFVRVLFDDARPLAIFPVVRISNMSVNTGPLDIYLLEAGTVIGEDTLPQFSGMPVQVDTGFFGPDAGMYEMTATLTGEKVPVSAPLAFDIANGDIVDIVIFDTVDPAVVDLVIVDSTTTQP